MTITFITGNPHKFAEASAVIPTLRRLDMDLPEIQEIDARAVIAAKLQEASRRQPGGFVVEDTSLMLGCLGGLPGPLIKWFLVAVGNRGLAEMAQKLGNDQAVARTMVGYTDGNGEISYFEGAIQGRIVAPTGKSPFGWDPIFLPDGHAKTFQQMTREEKNAFSMRKQAFTLLKAHLDAR
jgi:inosine triphosphate pyrophosphatase